MNIILPRVSRTKANAVNPRIIILYGEPKCGKSYFAASLPNNLLIDIEDGTEFLEHGTIIKASSLDELGLIGDSIAKENELNLKPIYNAITLDSATKFEVWIEEYATLMYKASTIGKNFNGESVLELPKGAGYYWLRQAFAKWFDFLRPLAKTFILLVHVRDKMLVDKNGREVSTNDLDLTGKLKQITCSKADAIGYVYRKAIGAEEGKPIFEYRVNFGTGLEVAASCRPKHLYGQDFVANWSKILLPEGD